MEPYLKMRKYEDKECLQQIQLIYSHKGEVLKLDTNVKTKSIYWTGLIEGINKKIKILRGRVTSRCSEIGQNQNDLNDRLKKAESDLDRILLSFRLKNRYNPDVSYVKEEFNKDEQKVSSDPEVKEQLRLWIPIKEKEIKDSTVKIYITLLHDLINIGLSHPIKNWRKVTKGEFEELLKKSKPIYFRQIDKSFKDRYISYLEKIGCQNPTINKRFEAFKAFLNAMLEDSITEYSEFQKFKVNRNEIQQDVIIPSPRQFIQLIKTNIKSERLDYARSLFVLSCVSGLRYSDIMQITPARIHQEGIYKYIQLIQKKSNKPVKIPLHPIGDDILRKYDYHVHRISNQKLNVALREVFKHLEFNDSVTVNFKKWEKMGFHSGRRFFCSMLVNGYNGFRINLGNVKKLSGHSSPIIEQYVKEGEKEEEEMIKLFSSFLESQQQ
jgi:site-specific recombinase XerD